MPEYGRASGGQIRFVTKSGSNRYSGQRVVLPARRVAAGQLLGPQPQHQRRSRTRARRRSTTSSTATPSAVRSRAPCSRTSCSSSARRSGSTSSSSTNTRVTVPTEAMRRGDFSELLNPANGFFSGARVIIDPQTGQPFPGNIIPANRLSPNGMAILNAYPLPTPGFRQGTANLIQTSDEPAGSAQGQHPPRLPAERRTTSSPTATRGTTGSAVDAFRGDFPFARTDLDRPNFTSTASWTTHDQEQPDQRAQLHASRATTSSSTCSPRRASTSAAAPASTIPYIFPDNKEIEDKIPTVTIGALQRRSTAARTRRRRPARSTPSRTSTTMVRGRHTFKAGVLVEYSGEDDFDQINVSAIPGGTNNQNGRFEFPDGRAGGTGLGDRQRRAGPVQQLRRARPAQLHQVARARDRPVHPGFVEADAAT